MLTAPVTLTEQSVIVDSLTATDPLETYRHPPAAIRDPAALAVQPLIVEPLTVTDPPATHKPPPRASTDPAAPEVQPVIFEPNTEAEPLLTCSAPPCKAELFEILASASTRRPLPTLKAPPFPREYPPTRCSRLSSRCPCAPISASLDSDCASSVAPRPTLTRVMLLVTLRGAPPSRK